MKIEAIEVDFFYGENRILNEISLSAEEKNLVGIIGPNGSGKTTLLKTLSGLLKPQNGLVFLNGGELSSLGQREIAKNLAVVPQDTAINFDFTAFEIVKMGRTPHLKRLEKESERDSEIAVEALRLTKTLDLQNRSITTLSGGERQKVLIAKALAQQPKILLLDEPTANLDIAAQIEIMDLISKVVKEKSLTALMAIHDINLAARYCNSMILLKRGKIFAEGRPESVLTKRNIKEVFGIDSVVNGNPADGSVFVVPLSQSKKNH